MIVGQRAAQPTFRHVVHPTAFRLRLHETASLPFCTDEDDLLALLCNLSQEVTAADESLDRLANIDDVDLIALAEDIITHLRMPTTDTVAKVDAGVDQILNLNDCHLLLLSCGFAKR